MIEKQVKDREEAMDSDISPAETSWLFAFSRHNMITAQHVSEGRSSFCLIGEMDLGLAHFKRAIEGLIKKKKPGQVLIIKTAPQEEYDKYCNKKYFKYGPETLEEIIIYRELHIHLLPDISMEELEPYKEEVRWTTNTSKYGIRERSKVVTKYRYNMDSCEAKIQGQILHIWGTYESLLDILEHPFEMATRKSYGFNNDMFGDFGTLPPKYHQIKAGNIPIYSYNIEGTCFEYMGGRPS
ncbi:MAG: hypothetical protein HRT90_11795 [Candidatus Margulisbacteria bacterium]|nr:hypothetical protein [Candidatus Margulisiibacteriota bacterium]